MTVVGLDDTDAAGGMCTTYLAARLADRVERELGAAVHRRLLVRLNPAVPHKTRGNAALAVHTDADADAVFGLAVELVETLAETDADGTNPGVVVAPDDPASVSDAVAAFAAAAVRDHHAIAEAETLLDDEPGYRHRGWGNGRGRIGALAAVGAWRAFDDWTYEHISYREPERWGTERAVDGASVLAADDAQYPTVWDTVDRGAGDPVCVPHTPCPILHGIRGDDPDAVRTVAESIGSEPVERAGTFVTTQGTDAHLQVGELGALANGRAYRVDGVVATPPETRQGGHVFFDLMPPATTSSESPARAPVPDGGRAGPGGGPLQPCVAFEPTKRFRDHVRALRPGDVLTVCGEVADGTLKLEKFAVRELVETAPTTPTCPDCDRTMESAGADQGYRCRDCETSAPGPAEEPLDRDLEPGWYEVPPSARRHIAKPLVRGGFDAPTHPER